MYSHRRIHFKTARILRGAILAALLLISALILSVAVAEASFSNEPEGAPYFSAEGEPEGAPYFSTEGEPEGAPYFSAEGEPEGAPYFSAEGEPEGAPYFSTEGEPEGAPYFSAEGEPGGQIVYMIEGPDAASPTFVILQQVNSTAGFAFFGELENFHHFVVDTPYVADMLAMYLRYWSGESVNLRAYLLSFYGL